MVRRRDWPAIARALREQNIYTRLPFPHWLGKALHGKSQVDVIFSGGNGLTKVDDDGSRAASRPACSASTCSLSPPEELLWSKAFVMERERFDGADVLHLILAMVDDLDWRHLCERFRGHEKVLLAHVVLFQDVYPDHASRLPRWLIPALLDAQDPAAMFSTRLCRGTLLSRAQYLVDVEKRGFADARRPPFGPMTDNEYQSDRRHQPALVAPSLIGSTVRLLRVDEIRLARHRRPIDGLPWLWPRLRRERAQ